MAKWQVARRRPNVDLVLDLAIIGVEDHMSRRSALPLHPQQGHFLFEQEDSLASDPTPPGSEVDPAVLFDALSDNFLSYYGTVRGIVRREVIRSNLGRYLAPCQPLRILDVGCGEGLDALWLVQCGYHVTGIDPSEKMLNAARQRASRLRPTDRRRLDLRVADDRKVLKVFGANSFDVILCHGVIMYQADPESFVANLSSVLRPHGILSLVTKNAGALAYRSAAERQFDDARRLLSSGGKSVGRLGVETKGHTMPELCALLEKHSLKTEHWFGVRVFSDSLSDSLTVKGLQELVELESAASCVDPYRHSARLLQAVATKRPRSIHNS